MTIVSPKTPIARGQLVDDGLREEIRAHSLGHRYYQAFLLGAERNVVSAMRRANTPEARAAEFIESVSPGLPRADEQPLPSPGDPRPRTAG